MHVNDLPNPGDFIEWIETHDDGIKIINDDELFSSVMKRWVPIGGRVLLISIAGVEYWWLSERGLFGADIYDSISYENATIDCDVTIRAVRTEI